jgi:hypothetical protein
MIEDVLKPGFARVRGEKAPTLQRAPAMTCTRIAISTSRRRGYRWLAGISEEDARAECGNGVIPAGPGASLLPR